MESASKYPKVMDEIEVHSGRGEQLCVFSPIHSSTNFVPVKTWGTLEYDYIGGEKERSLLGTRDLESYRT